MLGAALWIVYGFLIGAIPVIAHDNQQIEPVCDYAYDAIYRLIETKGREHIGQMAFDFDPPNANFRD